MKLNRIIPLVITFAGTGMLIGLIVLRVFNTPKPTAGLKVDTTPPSLVFVNNVQVGQTPLDQMFPPGDATVKLVPATTSSDLSAFQTTVKLTSKVYTVIHFSFDPVDAYSSGETVSLMPQSEKQAALGIITTNPDSASVLLDNEPQGYTPLNISPISPTDHRLEINAPGYETTSITAKAVNGYKLLITAKLAAKRTSVPSVPSGLLQPTPIATPSSGLSPTPGPVLSKKSQVKISSTPTGFLRVRKSPSTGAPEIGRVNPGETFDLLNTQTGWFEISGSFQATGSGWISSQYAVKTN